MRYLHNANVNKFMLIFVVLKMTCEVGVWLEGEKMCCTKKKLKLHSRCNYRVLLMARPEEFESPTFWSVARRSIQLS